MAAASAVAFWQLRKEKVRNGKTEENKKYRSDGPEKHHLEPVEMAVPLMLGIMFYKTLQPGRYLEWSHYIGDNALAAVGSSYTLMTFLTSIVIGLCLGKQCILSMAYGKKNQDLIRNGILVSAKVVINSLAVTLTGIIYIWVNPVIRLLQVPAETTLRARISLCASLSLPLFYIIMLPNCCGKVKFRPPLFPWNFRDLKYFSGYTLCCWFCTWG